MSQRPRRQSAPIIPEQPHNGLKKIIGGGVGGAIVTAMGNAGMFVDPGMGAAAVKQMTDDIAANPTNPLIGTGIGMSLMAGKQLYGHIRRYRALNDHFEDSHNNARS
ncbi:hypothetical protein UFOVP223_55 [uncultured Caudovirales phage]|uniref:Uncharacterized protein n=1 Tax=uncultured Caudovirales phage TaxID=2100421 RepID=A0A6J7WRA2_9CAUD|nr:hypothetical protein UFOVP110_109 [uncultured Caudovirales phage]CAB5219305.1 hypothetical protein UFOVP223_55 [uncultured Caudovirales phage]